MLFKRRHKMSWVKRLVAFLWPQSGLKRSLRYLWHRIARLPDTPHRIAAGIASGAAVSFTPLLGLHFLLAFAIAYVTRGNFLAAAIGTAVGNPWTFPIFFTFAEQVGSLFMGDSDQARVHTWVWGDFIEAPLDYLASYLPIIKPMIIGSLPIAILAWFAFYFGLKGVLGAYKAAQLHRRTRHAHMAPRCPEAEAISQAAFGAGHAPVELKNIEPKNIEPENDTGRVR